jgi:hypothetical protein
VTTHVAAGARATVLTGEEETMENERKSWTGEILAEPSGANGQPERAAATYCAFCGEDLAGAHAATRRFGELFCGEGHAAAFVSAVRAARAEATAQRSGGDALAAAGDPDPTPQQGQSQWELKRGLKLGACCGLPILALVVLVGGGGALLGGAAALLPTLALLACPLGMFFMMRAMRHDGGRAERGPGDSKDRANRER